MADFVEETAGVRHSGKTKTSLGGRSPPAARAERADRLINRNAGGAIWLQGFVVPWFL
jgi:hypothetical protein